MNKIGLFRFKTLNIWFFGLMSCFFVLYPEKADFRSIFQAHKSYLIFVWSLYQGASTGGGKIMMFEEEEWDWEDEDDEEEEDW
jgi:hypothetical protein